MPYLSNSERTGLLNLEILICLDEIPLEAPVCIPVVTMQVTRVWLSLP